MIEAMACGTPVIGFKRGSVPEVIEDGVNGFIVNTIREMEQKIAELPHINRSLCRETAANHFDVKVIAPHYLNLFNE